MGGKGSIVRQLFIKLFIKIKSYKYVTAFSIWTRFHCPVLEHRFQILLKGNHSVGIANTMVGQVWTWPAEIKAPHPGGLWLLLSRKGQESGFFLTRFRRTSPVQSALVNRSNSLNIVPSIYIFQIVIPFSKVVLRRFQCFRQTDTDFFLVQCH